MEKSSLTERSESARHELVEAEKALATALEEIERVSKAQKVTISRALEEGIARLRAANSALAEIERLLKSDDL